MKKLKKYEKVERFLFSLMLSEDFNINRFMKLKSRDIADLPELKGIGERTIRNCLNSFKEMNQECVDWETIYHKQLSRLLDERHFCKDLFDSRLLSDTRTLESDHYNQSQLIGDCDATHSADYYENGSS